MSEWVPVKIDFTPYLVEALATNKALHHNIDRLYKKDKTRYYELAKSSPWYTHPFITASSLKTEMYARRVLGLLEGLEASEVISLLRKRWPRVYNTVAKASSVSAGMITQVVTKSQYEHMSDDKANGYATVIICLGHLMGKPIAQDIVTSDLAKVWQERLQHASGDRHRFNFKALAPNEKEKATKLREELLSEAHIDSSKVNVHLNNTEHAVAKTWRDAIGFLFDTEDLTESIFDDAPLVSDNLAEITCVYNMCFPTRADAMQFLVSGIYIKRLLRAYKLVKEQFWANTAETLFPELDSLQRQLAATEEERDRLRQVNGELDDRASRLTRQVASEYNRAAAEKQGEIQQLRDRVHQLESQAEDDRRELAALRELFFSLSSDGENVPSAGNLDSLAELRNVRGLVAGGHERWQQRMKTLLPNFTFLHTDALSFDPSIFRNTEVLFIHSGYISHKFYYRVMATLRSYPHIPLRYLHSTNPDRSLQEIAAAMER